MSGAENLIIEARAALLDALAALEPHRDSVVLVGAQAVYLHTGDASFAVAATTSDSDLALDPRTLGELPHIEDAMTAAGFVLNPATHQPGAWLSPSGIQVDLMVPEHLAGGGGRRSARMPPHARNVARRTVGLEAAIVDNARMTVESLDGDGRSARVNVAGPAALIVAKLHKIGERLANPSRLNAKDAHDMYRLLVVTDTGELASTFRELLGSGLAEEVTRRALLHLRDLFAAGPDAVGSQMAGRSEQGIGQPDVVAASVSLLAADLLAALRS